jgi:RNA polymerase sigma-70 factor (ECF subfamily)
LPLNVDDVDDNYIYYKATPGKYQMTPEQQFFAKVLDDDITTAVDGLRDEFKRVVVLFFLRGYSYREIAHEVDLPLGTVRSRLYRGRQLLQRRLGNYAKRNRFIASDTK